MKDYLKEVKDFCNHEYSFMKNYIDWKRQEDRDVTFSIDSLKSRCFGAMMFTLNNLLGYDSPEGEELREWWDNEMMPAFDTLY